MSNFTNLLEQAFGTDKIESKHEQETDFTVADNFDETVKEMHIESEQAEKIGESIDRILDESQNPVSLGIAEESLYNMNVIGMKRLFKLRNRNSYTTEDFGMIAIGAAVAAAILVVIGLVVKYLEYVNEYIGSNKDKISDSRKNMGKTIDDYEAKWKSKYDLLAANPSDERMKSFKTELSHEIAKITYNTQTIIYHQIKDGKIGDEHCREYIKELHEPYKVMVMLAEKTVDLKDELNRRIDHLKDSEKETDATKKKEMESENSKLIKECVDILDKFYHDNYRIYHDVLPASLINKTREFFKRHDKIPAIPFPDTGKIDAKILKDYYMKIANGIKDSRDIIISSSSSSSVKPFSFDEIANSTVDYRDGEDYSNELKALEKDIEDTVRKFESYEKDFKGSQSTLFRNITRAQKDHGAKKLETEYKELFQYFGYITKALSNCVSLNIKFINAITILHKSKETALILRTLNEEANNEPTLQGRMNEINLLFKK